MIVKIILKYALHRSFSLKSSQEVGELVVRWVGLIPSLWKLACETTLM